MIILPWDGLLLFTVVIAVMYEMFPQFRFFCRLALFFSVNMVCAILLIPIAIFRPGNVHNTVLISHVLGPVLNTLLGIKWHIRNTENFIEDGSILVCNHQSALDFQGMVTLWPTMKRCAAIAKKELNYFGPWGFTAWLCGTIFIERSRPNQAHSTMLRAGDIAKEKKLKLWIFPEGTRGSGAGMLPFKKGAFYLAISSQLPITPIVYSRYHFLDSYKWRFDPGEVIVTILPPISTEGMTLEQMPQLMDRVQKLMMDTYNSTSAELLVQAAK